MTSFAAYLVGNDYMTAAEVEEVTQATVLYGGRLGTAVVEAGLMTPDEVDHALAQHLGLPDIPKEWLKKPDPGARAAIHVDLVKRHRAFPLHFEKRTLHIGLVDPKDANILDALAFASGCLIAPYALTELRFAELMQRVYGVAPSPRLAALLEPANLARLRRGRDAQREVKRSLAAAEPREFALGPLAADVDLVDEATFEAMTDTRPALRAAVAEAWEAPPELQAAQAAPAPPATAPAAEPPRRATPPAGAEALRRAEAALCGASERSAVIDATLELAGVFAELAALFVVRDGVAAGLRALRGGEPLDVEAIVAPLGGEGLLADAVRTGQPVRRAPSAALDKTLAKALRAEPGAELAAFPISIGGRVVNVLVAQSGASALPATAAAAFGALVLLVGQSYERLIRAFKQQSTPGA